MIMKKYHTTKETKPYRLEIRLAADELEAVNKIRKKHKRNAADIMRNALLKAAAAASLR